jgi:hypothetical protein
MSRSRRRDSSRSQRVRVMQVVAALGAVVGLLVSATSLIDWLGGKLDDPEPAPPGRIDPEIERLRLSAGQESLGGYLAATAQSQRGLSAQERRELGYVFVVHVRLRGGTGERFPLRWAVYEADPPQRLRDPLYNQTGAVFVPRGPDHATDWRLWVPTPPRPGDYFLRATLLNERRRPVSELDSGPFTVGSDASSGPVSSR